MGMGGNGPYLRGGGKTGGDENSDHFPRAEPQKSQVLHSIPLAHLWFSPRW